MSFPVLATVVASYRFVVRELPTIVRLTWAPLAIVAIIQYLSARHALSMMAGATSAADLTAAGARNVGWSLFGSTVEIIGTAIAAVSLHELILFGDRKPGAYFHANFGGRERRFVLLALAFGMTTIGMILLPLFAVAGGSKAYIPLATIAAVIIIIYLSVRLWPVFPNIVVTNQVEVGAAWAMTRGRFWSLSALGILGMLPTMLLIVTISFFLPDAESIAATPGSLTEKLRMVGITQTWQPLRSAFDFVMSIFNTAIGVALISFGYKALTGHAFEEPLTARA